MPRLYVIDSYTNRLEPSEVEHKSVARILFGCLEREWEKRPRLAESQVVQDGIVFDPSVVEVCFPEKNCRPPQQKNDVDCGVFVLEFA